jgi:DNA polymerase II small subunit/DNA polymerase delta subunit B
MSIPIEITAVILGFSLGFIAFLGQDALRRWFDKHSLRKKVLKNLIIEAEENKKILDVSVMVSLRKEAWDEAKNSGIAMDLRKELREKLVDLYSSVNEKNDLLAYHKIGVQFPRGLGIIDGTGRTTTPLIQIIGDLSDSLKNKISEIIPLLGKELDC